MKKQSKPPPLPQIANSGAKSQFWFKFIIKTFAVAGFIGISYALMQKFGRNPFPWSIGIPSIIALVIWWGLLHGRCPHCKAWNALEQIADEKVDSYMTTKNVTREIKRRGPDGQLIHTDSWQEEVPVEIVKNRITYLCKYCNKTHSEESEEEA